MSKRRIIISENALEPDAYEIHENVQYVREFLMDKFPTWPNTVHIYHEQVAQDHDVTPYDEASIERLEELEGDIFVIVFPEGPALLLGALLVVALVAVVVLLKPKVPEVATADAARNQQSASPNNELAARSNKPRIGARIPEIYGTVRSIPDLISQTYTYYDANRKVEIAYMCIGRGYYNVIDVRDADTLLDFIPGSAAQFYLPNQSPRSGHAAFKQVGSFIDDPLMRAKQLEQVVGQEMRPPNSGSATGASNFKFQYPDRIYNNVGYNFSDRFQAGDGVTITGATYSGASDAITSNSIARYVYNGGTPYVEWQSGAPNAILQAGDSLVISNSSTTGVKDTFTTSNSYTAKFTSSGRIDFSTRGSHPIEDGDDYRTGQSITLTGAVFNYDFAATYTYASKSTTKLFLTTPALTNSAWNSINGSSDYQSMSVGGITRTVRFNTSDNSIELQSGNFNDLGSAGTVVVSGSGAVFTTNLNGTYTLSSVNNGGNYWTLSSPSSTNAEWNDINGSTDDDTSITITQTHAGDTTSVDFNGTYTISSVTSTRIYLTNPGSVNSDWNLLSGFVSDRTEYPAGTDTFYVAAPVRTVNLNGDYTIVSVGLYEIILSNPSAVASDWTQLQFYDGANKQVIPTAPVISTNGNNYVGPFFLDDPDITRVYTSFVAAGGLYTDDGKDQKRKQVEIELYLYPATYLGVATGGAPQHVTFTMTGSALQRDTVAYTAKIALTNPGYNLIYARRITAKDTAFTGQVVDQVKWEDVFILSPETKTNFGNVTTVYTKTYATGGALAIKERKLNCLVQRKIPYITGWTGTYPNFVPVYASDLTATNEAWQIFCAMSIDPYFGNRDPSEIDFYGIAAASNDVYNYFGQQAACVQFCYTFDNTGISYEEAAQSIANAVFCTAYRQGSQIKWKPEIGTAEPVLIFNHRNKLPDSETRTVRFGAQNDHDGIQLEWVNPEDDGIETFFIPEDQSATASKKIETIGVRNITQATYLAWRSYYKLKYQNHAVEFDATAEAGLLVTKDKVLLADNTRADTQDGEVWDQNVLQLTLSQNVKFDPAKSYTIFLQHQTGYVEAIPITAVADNINVLKNVYYLQAGGVRFQVPADAGLLSVGDTVTLTGGFTDPTNGSLNLNGTYSILEVDGSTGVVLFDNPGAVVTAWTLITVTEGALRLNQRFESSRDAKRRVNLAYAPAAALNIDPESYARATYIIRSNVETAPSLFMVQDTTPKDNLTYKVSLVNFDSRFYYLDDLAFWMNFDDGTFRDASARGIDVYISTATGKATIGYNSVRKSNCYYNPTNSTAGWIKSLTLTGTRGSYTKAFWIRQGAGFDSYILSNAYEQFRVNNTNRLIAGHDGSSLTGLSTVTWPSNDGNWHHACITYDADAKILTAYIDGVKKAVKTAMNPPTVAANLQPLGLNSSGVASPYVDDIRYWKRAFTEQQVAELYNATR